MTGSTGLLRTEHVRYYVIDGRRLLKERKIIQHYIIYKKYVYFRNTSWVIIVD